MKMTDEQAVLSKLGLDFEVLDSGCCGMAGSFGFEKEHYDVSIKVGERVLLPAVRSAAKDTLIIADGFSCREQIAQTTDRQALHLAQVIQLALHQEGAVEAHDYLEAGSIPATQRHLQRRPSRLRTAMIVGASILTGGLALWWLRKRSVRSKR
jgi:hypothetical protein